jgi:hypothetical protein
MTTFLALEASITSAGTSQQAPSRSISWRRSGSSIAFHEALVPKHWRALDLLRALLPLTACASVPRHWISQGFSHPAPFLIVHPCRCLTSLRLSYVPSLVTGLVHRRRGMEYLPFRALLDEASMPMLRFPQALGIGYCRVSPTPCWCIGGEAWNTSHSAPFSTKPPCRCFASLRL